jgi:serine phosphatase RsbU (regulator of sigma subunit)
MAAGEFVAAITRIAHQPEYAGAAHIFHPAPQFEQIGVSSTFQFAMPDAAAGGDWYDVLPSHGRIAFVIGDVAGHGADAAFTAAILRRSIAKMLLQNEDPSTILSRANTSILKRKMPHATVLCGYVDPRSHEIVYACGGHPPAIIAHNKGASFTQYGGLMLGVQEKATYVTRRVMAPRRGLFVMYTDGVTELDHKILNGERRLLRAVREAVAEVSDAARAIQDRMFKDKKPVDDASILALAFGYPARSAAASVNREILTAAR